MTQRLVPISIISSAFLFILMMQLHSELMYIPILAFAAAILIIRVEFRFLYLIVGGLFVYQSSEGLAIIKLLYLAGLAFLFVISLKKVNWNSEIGKKAKPIVAAGYFLLAYLVLTGIVSVARGTDIVAVIRESAAFIILSVSPVIAADFATHFKQEKLRKYVITCSVLATFLCSIGWASKRGYIDFAQLGLASYIVPSALFSLAVASIMISKKVPLRKIFLSFSILAAMIFTGTRSSVVFLLAPVAMIFTGKIKSSHLIKLVFSVSVVAVIILAVLLNMTTARTTFLEPIYDRVVYTQKMFSSNNLQSDYSFVERINQTKVALNGFKESPLIGMGAGHTYTITRYTGLNQKVESLDSPLYVVAKYGFFGLFLLLFLFRRIYKTLVKPNKESWESLAFIGFGGITLGWMTLINPFDDKGFGLALIMLMSLVLANFKNKAAE